MKATEDLEILFVAGFGPIVSDRTSSWKLYGEAFALPLQEEDNGYLHTAAVEGVKHFALWPLSQAAHSCFGEEEWPEHVPAPQAWIEFEVEDVGKATTELKSRGYTFFVEEREEPWGQTVSRFLSPEGLLIGLTYTPWMRAER